MKLQAISIDFDLSELTFKLPENVMFERKWGKGECEVDIDTISEMYVKPEPPKEKKL